MAYPLAGLYIPSPYAPMCAAGWNVDISVSDAWETISPAQNARHHRASERESDAIAPEAWYALALASDGR